LARLPAAELRGRERGPGDRVDLPLVGLGDRVLLGVEPAVDRVAVALDLEVGALESGRRRAHDAPSRSGAGQAGASVRSRLPRHTAGTLEPPSSLRLISWAPRSPGGRSRGSRSRRWSTWR